MRPGQLTHIPRTLGVLGLATALTACAAAKPAQGDRSATEAGAADIQFITESGVVIPRDLGQPHDGCTPSCQEKCPGADDGCGGTCLGNLCSTCCKATQCLPGTQVIACGKGGATCLDCSYSSECQQGQCSAGACVKGPRPDGLACAGGKCRNGSCCTGCWNGARCMGGISNATCGTGGILCFQCTTTNPCKAAYCNTGNCVVQYRPFGHPCAGGRCLRGSCCTGCVSNNLCHPGNTKWNCGVQGGPCLTCLWNQFCSQGGCYN